MSKRSISPASNRSSEDLARIRLASRVALQLAQVLNEYSKAPEPSREAFAGRLESLLGHARDLIADVELGLRKDRLEREAADRDLEVLRIAAARADAARIVGGGK